MKKILFLYVIVVFFSCKKNNGSFAAMKFTEIEYDFGTINEGQKVEKDFLFTNSSKTDLQITGVRGSCGCTVAEYPKEPILPNKTGIIKVLFNSKGKHGKQTKTVTISANTLKGTEIVTIYADVKSTSGISGF